MEQVTSKHVDRPGQPTWPPDPDLLNVDGSLFGGYLATLADQALTFAAMTSVPDSMVFRTASIFRETSFLEGCWKLRAKPAHCLPGQAIASHWLPTSAQRRVLHHLPVASSLEGKRRAIDR